MHIHLSAMWEKWVNILSWNILENINKCKRKSEKIDVQ